MKAILVVDLPNNVNMDMVIQTPVALSFSLGDGIKQMMFANGYLKEMPQKMKHKDEIDYEYGYIDGRNELIDEIVGEK